jgi:hypothetical protein
MSYQTGWGEIVEGEKPSKPGTPLSQASANEPHRSAEDAENETLLSPQEIKRGVDAYLKTPSGAREFDARVDAAARDILGSSPVDQRKALNISGGWNSNVNLAIKKAQATVRDEMTEELIRSNEQQALYAGLEADSERQRREQ